MKKYYTYIITNEINNRKYIGFTDNPKRRWCEEKSIAFNPSSIYYDYPYYRAIRKYGWVAFDKQVLSEFDSKRDALDNEIYLVALHKTNIKKYGNKYGYNLTDGGELGGGMSGKKHTEEWKQSQSIRMQGNSFNTGKRRSEDTKIEMNKSRKKREPDSEETKANKSKAAKLRSPATEETNLKISNTLKAKNLTGENAIRYGTKQSEESIQKAADNNPNRKLDGEKVRKIKELYATGDYSYKDIGIMFGISYQYVGNIINGISGKYLK